MTALTPMQVSQAADPSDLLVAVRREVARHRVNYPDWRIREM